MNDTQTEPLRAEKNTPEELALRARFDAPPEQAEADFFQAIDGLTDALEASANIAESEKKDELVKLLVDSISMSFIRQTDVPLAKVSEAVDVAAQMLTGIRAALAAVPS